MLSSEMVIRKYKLCNGCFQTKYSSDQMYCSRIYKSASATCNEVGVKKLIKKNYFNTQSIRNLRSPNATIIKKESNKLYIF